jgi:hypothetical protein
MNLAVVKSKEEAGGSEIYDGYGPGIRMLIAPVVCLAQFRAERRGHKGVHQLAPNISLFRHAESPARGANNFKQRNDLQRS